VVGVVGKPAVARVSPQRSFWHPSFSSGPDPGGEVYFLGRNLLALPAARGNSSNRRSPTFPRTDRFSESGLFHWHPHDRYDRLEDVRPEPGDLLRKKRNSRVTAQAENHAADVLASFIFRSSVYIAEVPMELSGG